MFLAQMLKTALSPATCDEAQQYKEPRVDDQIARYERRAQNLAMLLAPCSDENGHSDERQNEDHSHHRQHYYQLSIGSVHFSNPQSTALSSGSNRASS